MKRGFTILEMMGALVILTIASLVGGRLIYQSITAIRIEQISLSEQSMRASLLRQMREDALQTTELLAIENGARLRNATGEVAYRLTETGAVREDGAKQVQWYLPVLQRLTVDGASITVQFDQDDPIPIIAPWALASKGASQ